MASGACFFPNSLCLHGVDFNPRLISLMPIGWRSVAKRDMYLLLYIQRNREHLWAHISSKGQFHVHCLDQGSENPDLPGTWNIFTDFTQPGPTLNLGPKSVPSSKHGLHGGGMAGNCQRRSERMDTSRQWEVCSSDKMSRPAKSRSESKERCCVLFLQALKALVLF